MPARIGLPACHGEQRPQVCSSYPGYLKCVCHLIFFSYVAPQKKKIIEFLEESHKLILHGSL